MSDFSNEPMVPDSGPEMSLIETWVSAFTKPNENTFARIAAQPSATSTKAFIWVFIASLLTTFVSLLSQAAVGQQYGGLEQILPPEIARELPIGAAPSIGFGTAICGAPVGALFAVIGFAIVVGLIQWIAGLFGGTGTFDKLAYTFSTITVPYAVVASVLGLFALIPFIGILFSLISFVLGIYVIVLEVQAVKAVNGLDTGRAVGSVLLPGLVFVLIICCCVILSLLMLGPAVGDVLDSINQNLGNF